MKPTFDHLGNVLAIVSDVHVAYTNTDLDERKGQRVILGAFTNLQQAINAGLEQGVMGTNCRTATIKALKFEENGRKWCVPVEAVMPLYDTADERLRKELRASALSKLTPQEIRALGLEDK